MRRAIDEARRLIGRLHPAGLDDSGLIGALRIYVAQMAGDGDWQVSFEADPLWEKLPVSREAALFRIVQEAAAQVFEHARARRVRIRLQVTKDSLSMSIENWGEGYGPREVSAMPQQSLNMGLVGIRERARVCGGTCVITSVPDKGMSIAVLIPRSRTSEG